MSNLVIKKRVILIPSAYNAAVLVDVIPFINYYRHDFDVYVISNKYSEDKVVVDDVNYVKNHTDYASYLICTADYLIDAGSVNATFKINAYQKRISIWHGIPYKNMFVKFDPLFYSAALMYSDMYDLMLSPSKYYTNKFLRDSMLYDGEVYETTMPRLENIIKSKDMNLDDVLILKQSLDLPIDKKILLYAPTLREKGITKLPCDFSKIQEILGDDWIMISKAHYTNSFKDVSGFYKDFTNYSNINDLLSICDVLVTDYSSTLFDYSILEKQLVLFQYDYEYYNETRGFMFDICDYLDKEYIAYSSSEFEAICKKISQNGVVDNTEKIRSKFYEHKNLNDFDSLVEKLAFDSTPYNYKEITFLINELNQIGGIHTFITNLAKMFKAKYNCKVNVLAIKHNNTKNQAIFKFDEENVFDIKLSSERNSNLCRSILQNTDGYVISCQFSSHLHFQRYLGNKNFITMFHGDMKDVVNRSFYTWHLDAINNKRIYNYKVLLGLTASNADLLKEHVKYDELKKKISSISNSYDFSNSKNLYKSSKVFVAVTRLDEDKNIFDLLEIFSHPDIDEECVLHVYGDGPLRYKFVEEIQNKGLQSKVILKGYCHNKEEIYKNKNGLVLTSLSEGFSLIVLEAANYCIPTILYDSFTAAKEVSCGVGTTIEVGDFDSFVNAINSQGELSIEDLRHCYSTFDNSSIIKEWEKLFVEVESLDNSCRSRNIRYFVSTHKQALRKISFKLRKYIRKYLKNSIRRHLININRGYQYYTERVFLMKQPLVSVIIPYYYASDTINNTLKSLKKMKYRNVEIIIVNDGSDDYTPPKWKNLKYHVMESNVGPGIVRNTGVELATGKYIAFLDSDDVLNKYGMSFLVNYAELNHLDVVSGITRRLDERTNKSHIWFKSIYKETYINESFDRSVLLSDTLATNKIYKTSVFKEKDLKFESGLYEDKLFTAQLYNSIDKIGIVNKDYYVWCYYGDNTSITSTLSIDNFRERVDKVRKILSIVDGIYISKYISFLISHDFRIYIRQFNKYSEEDKSVLFMEMRKCILEYEKFYDESNVNRLDNKLLVKSLLNNDVDRFNTISSYISESFSLGGNV